MSNIQNFHTAASKTHKSLSLETVQESRDNLPSTAQMLA